MRGKCVPLFVDREGMGKMVRTALRTFTQYGQKPVTAITRYATGSITHVTTQHPIAALTFDDGPHPKYTPQVLEIFAKYQAHATFFMLGENARKYPELVKRVSAEGHVVANHS
jgi:peptidoglycan/xylan/chitin deacetylase (PgdA/CDA1 family)